MPGASDTLTLRGMTVLSTFSPKYRRTSKGDLVGELRPAVVHGQRDGGDIEPGFRWALTMSMFFINWDTPSSA